MAMSKHLAVVLTSNTEAHLALIGATQCLRMRCGFKRNHCHVNKALGLEYSGNHTCRCSLADV